MVVDDNPVARFIVGDAIEEAALPSVIYCTTGKDAISYVKALLDYHRGA